jgi:hypothetical protein
MLLSKVGDFFKFRGLLKMSELYTKAFQVKSRVLKGTGHFMLRQSYFALVQVNIYEIVVKIFHISHNLT